MAKRLLNDANLKKRYDVALPMQVSKAFVAPSGTLLDWI